MIFLPNGIGETLGDQLVTGKPLTTTGSVFYVSSVTGNAGFTGLNKAQPLNTLGNAYTAAAHGDIIVVLDGHSELYAAPLTIAKRLTIVGSGSSSGIPTASFGRSADTLLFEITAAGVQLRNLKFPSASVATTAHRVDISVANVVIAGCYFDGDEFDAGQGVLLSTVGAASFSCRDSTFISSSETRGTLPGAGLRVDAAVADMTLSGLVFDGGVYGFASGFGYFESAAPTRRRGEQLSFLRGADAQLHASAVESYWMPTITTGDVRS